MTISKNQSNFSRIFFAKYDFISEKNAKINLGEGRVVTRFFFWTIWSQTKALMSRKNLTVA